MMFRISLLMVYCPKCLQVYNIVSIMPGESHSCKTLNLHGIEKLEYNFTFLYIQMMHKISFNLRMHLQDVS